MKANRKNEVGKRVEESVATADFEKKLSNNVSEGQWLQIARKEREENREWMKVSNAVESEEYHDTQNHGGY